MTRKPKTAAALLAALASLVLAAPAAQAKHGNDDIGVELRHGADNAKPRQDDRKAHARHARGADDRGGDRRGGDDGPNHT
jgi:hypothetical protein